MGFFQADLRQFHSSMRTLGCVVSVEVTYWRCDWYGVWPCSLTLCMEPNECLERSGFKPPPLETGQRDSQSNESALQDNRGASEENRIDIQKFDGAFILIHKAMLCARYALFRPASYQRLSSVLICSRETIRYRLDSFGNAWVGHSAR